MITAEARKLIGIDADAYTLPQLKKAFRTQSFIHHPDHGGTEESFQKLHEAYEALLQGSVSAAGPHVPIETETIEGNPLADLGKGYPLTESAITCDICHEAGFKAFHDRVSKEKTCSMCRGTGAFSYPCGGCRGTGKNTNPQTGLPVADCIACGGVGRYYPPSKDNSRHGGFTVKHITLPDGTPVRANKCNTCRGSGTVSYLADLDEVSCYTRCRKCEGRGEVKIYNPVLPRGLFAVGEK